MRARYVNAPELLTPLGNWIAARLPHVEGPCNPWPWVKGDHMVFRIYGGAPYYRRCLFDYTRTQVSNRRHHRLSIFGFRVYRDG